MKAVIDRFEGDKAVLLVGDEQRSVIVDRSQLPKRVKEGEWLNAEFDDDGNLTHAVKDPEATREARARIMQKMNGLLNRPQQ